MRQLKGYDRTRMWSLRKKPSILPTKHSNKEHGNKTNNLCLSQEQMNQDTVEEDKTIAIGDAQL